MIVSDITAKRSCGSAAPARGSAARLIVRLPGLLISTFRRGWRRLRMYLLLPMFREHGRNIWFDPDGFYSFENIILGSDVFLGIRPTIMASRSIVRIGSKVMFGPGVTLIGGNHNAAEFGRFMYDVTEKRPCDDRGIVIEDDVWVGSRAVILRGVTIGRGSIVGAGSIVTKDVPAYSIVAGCPARIVKFRWSIEAILHHEEKLYSTERRIPVEALRSAREALDRAGVPA